MKKRIFGIIMSVILTVISLNISIVANAAGSSKISNQHKEGLLNSLRLLPESDNAEEIITLDYASKVCLGLYGMDYDIEIPVTIANQTGITEETEVPEGISYKQLTEMLLEILGYDIYVGDEEYLSRVIYADGIGLYEDLTVTDYTANVDYEAFVTIIYNALHVNLMEMQVNSKGEKAYSVKKDETILSEYLDTYFIEGIVTADFDTSLYSKDTVKGYSIGGVMYYSDTRYNVHPGYAACGYVCGDEIVYLYEDRKNSVSEIKGQDVAATLTDKSKLVTIDSNKRRESYNLASGTSYMYNGVYLGPVQADIVPETYLEDNEMTYTLVDNNSDGTIDCIYANKYTYIKISQKNPAEMEIYDEWTGGVIEVLEEDVFYYSDGMQCSFNEIKKSDIVAAKVPIGESLSSRNKKMDFVILTQIIVGKATGTWSEGIEIDGEEYRLNAALDIPAAELIGKSGDFLLDMNGRIIRYSEKTGEELSYRVEYAYIYDVYQDEEADAVMVKAFRGNGIERLELKEKASLVKGATTLYQKAITIFNNKSEVAGKLVRIKQRDDVISKIELAQALTYGKCGDGSYSEFNYVAGRSYKCRGSVLNDLYRVNSNSQVFCIPDDGDRSEFRLLKWENYSHGEDVQIELYGVDENFNAELCMVTIKSGFSDKDVNPNNQIFVVEKTLKTLNEDDEVCVGLKGWFQKEYVELMFDDSDAASITNSPEMGDLYVKRSVAATELECGDVIQITQKENGAIDGFRMLHDVSYDTDFQRSISGNSQKDGYNWSFASPFVSKDLIYAFGSIEGKGNEFVTLKIGDATNLRNVFSSNLSYVYKCNLQSKEVEITTLYDPDIKKGATAFITLNWSNERDLVVYY